MLGRKKKQKSSVAHCIFLRVFFALLFYSLTVTEAEKQHDGAGVRSSREGRALQPRKSPQREAAERGAATLRLLCAKEGSASRIFCVRGLRTCRNTATSASRTAENTRILRQHLFFPSRYMPVRCWCGRTQRNCAYEE